MCSGCSKLQRELQEARQVDSDLRVEVAALKREAEREARQQESAKKAATGDTTWAVDAIIGARIGRTGREYAAASVVSRR